MLFLCLTAGLVVIRDKINGRKVSSSPNVESFHCKRNENGKSVPFQEELIA